MPMRTIEDMEIFHDKIKDLTEKITFSTPDDRALWDDIVGEILSAYQWGEDVEFGHIAHIWAELSDREGEEK